MATIVELKQQLIDCLEKLDKSLYGLDELKQCVELTSQLSQIGAKPVADYLEEVLQGMKKQDTLPPPPPLGLCM